MEKERKISKTKIVKRASKKTDLELKRLIYKLKSSKSEFWLEVAKLLSRPRRKAIEVNLKKLNEELNPNDVALVPGKVLGSGIIEKPITVACYKISNSARQTLVKSNSKILSIEELYNKNKEGKGVKLVM
ncbi:MAG: 50S ribosomal protein L18e [Candidatus Pacearchaeota archaeon]